MKKQHALWLRAVLGAAIAVAAAALVLILLHIQLPTRPEMSSTSAGPVVSEPVILPDNPKDFAALRASYPEIIGWIEIPGTVIDYPLMQSGADTEENYYLHHAPDGSYRYAGSIFIQKLNAPDMTDVNTLLYGHYMANGSMFADLHQFRKEAVFNQYQYIYIFTPGHVLTYQIYSCFVHTDRHVLYEYDFSDPVEYAEFLDLTFHPTSYRQQVREGVAVTTDDRIITLSTCTTNSTERWLVVAVLVEDMETK